MTDVNPIEGIISIQVYGYPCIKLSDYLAKHEEWNLDERDILICPDHMWSKLEVVIGAKLEK